MTNFDVLAGTIIAAHGVQGAVKLRVATETAIAMISTGDGVSRRPVDVLLGPGDMPPAVGNGGRMAVISQVKELREGGRVYLVKLQGVRDRNQAEEVVGLSVFAPASRRAPLQEGEFFTEQLIGMSVMSDSGRDYGKIKAVLLQPGNDVYETDLGALIPAVKAVVLNVDVAAGKMIVADLVGLLPDEAEVVEPGDGPGLHQDDADEAVMDRVPA